MLDDKEHEKSAVSGANIVDAKLRIVSCLGMSRLFTFSCICIAISRPFTLCCCPQLNRQGECIIQQLLPSPAEVGIRPVDLDHDSPLQTMRWSLEDKSWRQSLGTPTIASPTCLALRVSGPSPLIAASISLYPFLHRRGRN